MSLGIFKQPIKFARPISQMRGLGEDAGCVWKNTDPNPAVKSEQVWLNTQLKAHGFNAIGTDGKLGPATCGAWLYLFDNFDDFYVSQEPSPGFNDCCQGWTWPTKVGSTTPEKNTYLANMWTEATKAGLPYGTYSDKTLEVQKQLNSNLVSHDMNPFVADGKLGPVTCGAARWVDKNTGQYFFDYTSICKSYTDPTSAAKVAANTVIVPPPSSVVPTPADSAVAIGPSSKGKMSTATMVTGGLAVGALAVGYYYAKKKGWF